MGPQRIEKSRTHAATTKSKGGMRSFRTSPSMVGASRSVPRLHLRIAKIQSDCEASGLAAFDYQDSDQILHAVFVFLFFSARDFAHRAFDAFEIFALAAADITCFLTCVTSRMAEPPSAFAAARNPLNLFCNLLNSFSSFRSSRLIAASRSMSPPGHNLSYSGGNAPDVL